MSQKVQPVRLRAILRGFKEAQDFHFQRKDRKRVSSAVARYGSKKNVSAFVRALESEIGKFQTRLDLRNESRDQSKTVTRSVGKTLAALEKYADKMRNTLAAATEPPTYRFLDMGLTASQGSPGVVLFASSPMLRPPWIFIDKLMRDLEALHFGVLTAQKMKKHDRGGGPAKGAQILLARGILQAWREHLQGDPTTSQDKDFDYVLRVCREVAGDLRRDSKVNQHRIVLAAFKGTEPFRKPNRSRTKKALR